MSTVFIANASLTDVRGINTPAPQIPIIDKALGWIDDININIDQIVLFVSQDDPHNEIAETGQTVEAFIRTYVDEITSTLGPEQIQMITVEAEAANYDVMLHFYSQALQQFDAHDAIYMEVTGGTAAMSFVLLWQGIALFKDKVSPLYVTVDHDKPLRLDIGNALLLEAMLDDYQDLIEIYQYHAALQVLHAHEGLCRQYWPYYDAIRAVTKHARQRINFNFEEAETSLRGLMDTVPSEFREQLNDFIVDLDDRDAAWILREEIYTTDFAIRNGEFKDALTSMITFREGLMRYYVIALDVPLIDDNRVIDPDWLAKQHGLRDHLRQKNINIERWLTSKGLDKILEYKGKFNPHIRAVCKQIDLFDQLGRLRNQAVHHHAGVSPDMINDTFPGGIKAIVPTMHDLYKEVTKRPIREDYYDDINRYILALIHHTPA